MSMSFRSYLMNMGIDVVLGLAGLIGLLGAAGHYMEGNTIIATIFLIIGGLSLLYTRYRAQKKGITY